MSSTLDNLIKLNKEKKGYKKHVRIEKQGKDFYIQLDGVRRKILDISLLYNMITIDNYYITNPSIFKSMTKVLGTYRFTSIDSQYVRGYSTLYTECLDNFSILKVENHEIEASKLALLKGYKKLICNPFYALLLSKDKNSMLLLSDLTLVVTETSRFSLAYLKIRNIVIKNLDVSLLFDINNFFLSCMKTETIYLENFDTRNIESMKGLFRNCSSLVDVNIDSLSTENVYDMSFMFFDCTNLKDLDLNNFNVKRCKHFENMFVGCSSLKRLSILEWLPNFNINCESMFAGCMNLVVECSKQLETILTQKKEICDGLTFVNSKVDRY